jgi:hemoglobin/transferrin/lactoferrin receptor protein
VGLLTLPAAAAILLSQAISPFGETIVVANRSVQPALEVPYSIYELDAVLLIQRAYRSMPQALRDIPGVLLQETSYGQGSPYLRGFTGQLNNFLIDGIRLNNSVFRSGPNQYWNTVDPYSLDRIEVVMGPSSVLYGADAIGGTVQVFTLGPKGYGVGTNYEARAYYRFATAERSNIVRTEAGMTSGEEWGAFVGLTLMNFGDVIGGRETGTQENTGYSEWSADLKLEHFIKAGERLVFAHQNLRQNDVPRTHRTIFAEPFEGTTPGSDLRRNLDQERRLTYLQYHAEARSGALEAIHANLSWHEQSETRDRIRGGGAQDFQGFDVGTLGFFSTFEGRASEWGRPTFGVDYYRDQVDSFSSTEPIQGPVGDDANYDLLGVFVQDEIDVNDAMTVTLGGRFTYASADADSVVDPVGGGAIEVSDHWSRTVASLRILYRLRERALHLFGGVSQGFRAPNLSDLTRFDSARTDEFEVPATDLESEDYLSFELGVKSRTRRQRSELALFYTAISNQITRVPTGNTNADGEVEITKDNVGDGYVFGIEAGGAFELASGWTLFGNAAYIEGKVDTFPTSEPIVVEEYLDRLMPFQAQTGLEWLADGGDFWAEAVVRYGGDADRLSTRDRFDTSRIPPGGTPGYVLLDFRLGWNVRPELRLDLGLENILDEDYRVHGSGSNGPGRSLIVGLTLGG